jgi:hypothetical protein
VWLQNHISKRDVTRPITEYEIRYVSANLLG